jgi:chromosome segregation ATPase
MESKKRPANPRSRGDSPPEKRSRSFTSADRPATTRRATDPRPLPAVSRAPPDQPGQHSPFYSGCASKQGSGATTPTQIAPPVPSMVPVPTLPVIFQESRAPEPVNDAAVPASLASLRLLRMKKQAMAKDHPPHTTNASVALSTAVLQAQLKAAQIEMSALRRQMKSLENLPAEVSNLKAKLNEKGATADDSNSLQAVLRRLEALEKSKLNTSINTSTESTNAAVHKQQLDKLERLASNIAGHGKQLEKVQAWMDKHSPALDTLPSLKKDMEDVKSQTKGKPDTKNVEHMIDNAKQGLRAETKNTSAQLTKMLQGNHKAVQELTSKVTTCLDLTNNLQQQSLPLQVQTLRKEITDIGNAHAKFNNLDHALAQLRLTFDKHKSSIDKDLEKQDDAQKELDKQMSILNSKVKDCPTTSSLQYLQSAQAHETNKLAAQQNATEAALKRLSDEYESLCEERSPIKMHGGRLDRLDQLVDSLQQSVQSEWGPVFASELRDRLSSLEQTASTNGQPDSDREGLQALRADVEQLGTNQTNLKAELEDVQGDINAASNAIDSIDKEVHNQSLAVESLRSGISTIITNLFNEQLDPLQADVDQTMSSVRGDLKSLTDELTALKQQVGRSSRTQTPQSGFTASQSAHLGMLEATSTFLKAQVTRLQDQLEAETNQRNEDMSKLRTQTQQSQSLIGSPKLTSLQASTYQVLVQEMSSVKQELDQLRAVQNNVKGRQDHEMQCFKDQLAAKQDTVTAERSLDVVRLGVRNLQDQYNNITTDNLHQQMVHWFLAQYPSNTADLLLRLQSAEQELNQLKSHWQQVSWIQSYAVALRALVKNGSALSPPIPNGNFQQQIATNANEAVDAARIARAKSEAADKRVTECNAEIQTLNARLEELIAEERSTRAEFVTKAGAEYSQRVMSEEKLRTSIHQLREETQKDTIIVSTSLASAITRLEQVETASNQLRDEYNTTVSTIIEPNADFLGRLKEVFVAVAQLQQATARLHQKLPREKSLQLSWTHDLSPLLETGARMGNEKEKEKR